MRTQDQEGLPEQVSHPRERQRSRSLRFNLSERKNRTDRRTRNPSRWWSRFGSLPTSYRGGPRRRLQGEVSPPLLSPFSNLRIILLGFRISGARRPPRLPRGNSSQAQHGDPWTELPEKGRTHGNRCCNCNCTQPYCPTRGTWNHLPQRWTVRGGSVCKSWRHQQVPRKEAMGTYFQLRSRTPGFRSPRLGRKSRPGRSWTGRTHQACQGKSSPLNTKLSFRLKSLWYLFSISLCDWKFFRTCSLFLNFLIIFILLLFF